EILEGGSLDARTIQHVFGLTVCVELGRSYQSIAAGNARPVCASDERVAGQIPDCRLTGAGIDKQIIGFVIASEVRHADHFPVSWKSWTIGAAEKNIVILIPNRCLVCACIVKQIIGLAIAVKVSHTNDFPTSRKGGSTGAGDKYIVVQVPDCRAR